MDTEKDRLTSQRIYGAEVNIENVKEAADLIQQGMNKLAKGPLDYYLRNLAACYEFLLTFAPYQPGARVRLTKTPEISDRERWGWLRAKHFMKTGAIATIVSVSSDGHGFDYGLVFDEDSWMDHHKVVHSTPESERGIYGLTAEWFEKLPSTVTEKP